MKRTAYRDRYLNKPGTTAAMERVNKMLAEAKTAEAREEANEQLKQLNRPVDRHFTRLKDDLDKLPTRQQRAQAAKRRVKTQAAARSGSAIAAGDRAAHNKRDPGSP